MLEFSTNQKYTIGGQLMQRAIKQPEQKPITLKGWVFAPDGKEIKELIMTSFLEFYFAKRTAEIRQNA